MTEPHDAGDSTQNDVLWIVQVLSRFNPAARRKLALIGATSFVMGLSEAGILVLITGAAVTTAQESTQVTVGPLTVERQAVLWGALGLLALNMAISYIVARVIASVSAESALIARQRVLEGFHHASYQRKTQDRIAALQEALTTYVDRFTAAFAALGTLLSAILTTVSFAVAALVVNPLAAVALAFIGGLLIVVLRPATSRTRRAAGDLALQRRAYAEGATESVLLARELSVFGRTQVAGDRLRALDDGVAAQFRTTRFLALVTPKIYQNLALGFAIGGLLLLGNLKVENLAAIGAVVLLLVRSLSYGQQILTGLQAQADHRPYIDRLMALLASYESEPRHRGTEPLGAIRAIDLDGVGFGYPGGAPALTDVTFSIAEGETLGILGPSGAGKSTLVNILLRLYEPTSGTVTANGTSLRDLDDEEWHRRTAIVPQEPRLLHGTVRDNIDFLRDLDDDTIHAAARDANIASFIATLPEGYDAHVGELGMGLSGGQRQRICIARALAGRPDLLVLDEPTSALDGDSEAAIQRTLEDLKGRVTMVVVAHRLSTLAICDRLAVLDDGRLRDIGTPEELEASSSYYREALRLAGL